MKKQTQLESLQNFLKYLQKHNEELEGLIFYSAENKRWCLARILERGAVDNLTEFLNYNEMNQFLRGYMYKANNRFIKN